MAIAQASDLHLLAAWMAGDFENRQQAWQSPTKFAHIRIFFRPLPLGFFGTALGFYSEQVYDYDLWSPYRQGVHRLVDRGDSIYVENYGFKDDPMLYAGAARDAQILATLSPEVIQSRSGCAMVFRREGDRFLGGVEPGNACIIPRGGRKTYLVSEVELTENTWKSRDRGFDLETHEHIWGSTYGALEFTKVASFAHELPG